MMMMMKRKRKTTSTMSMIIWRRISSDLPLKPRQFPSEIRSNCTASATAWALAHVPSGVQGGRDHAQRLGHGWGMVRWSKGSELVQEIDFLFGQDMISLTYTGIHAQSAQCLWIVRTTMIFDIWLKHIIDFVSVSWCRTVSKELQVF